jgi:hypothetical protein
MVPNVTPILQRFTTEWAALLQLEAILDACGEVGHKAWRHRVLTPVTTIQLFLLQILHGNTEWLTSWHSAKSHKSPTSVSRSADTPDAGWNMVKS